MKKYILFIAVAIFAIGCERTGMEQDKYPVSGRIYVETKYQNTELHFEKTGNKVLLIEHTEAGRALKTNQFFKMDADTICTYNNTKYDDIRKKYIYHDTYLTSYDNDNFILEER